MKITQKQFRQLIREEIDRHPTYSKLSEAKKRELEEGVWTSLKGIGGGVAKALGAAGRGIGNAAQGAAQGAGKALGAAGSAIGSAAQRAGGAVAGAAQSAGKAITSAGGAVKDAVSQKVGAIGNNLAAAYKEGKVESLKAEYKNIAATQAQLKADIEALGGTIDESVQESLAESVHRRLIALDRQQRRVRH